jgi:hypothetical protein
MPISILLETTNALWPNPEHIGLNDIVLVKIDIQGCNQYFPPV